MSPEQNIILEQYKLYVQMADNTSQRRTSTNQFYLSLLSILLSIPIIFSTKNFIEEGILSAALAIFGIILCILWILNIKSYKQLNSSKYQVINEIEKDLPVKCYIKEWELLENGRNKKKYLQLTIAEQLVPYLFLLPFIILLFVSFYFILYRSL